MSLPCTPAVELENDLSIDQKTSNIDTCSCQLNTILNSIAQALNELEINGSINIDINKFVNCTRSQWDKPQFQGMNDQFTASIRIQATNYYNGPAGAGLTEEEKAQRIQQLLINFNQSFKIVQWIGSGAKGEQTSIIVKNKTISIPITCSSSTQSYSNEPSNECSGECIVDIPIFLATKTKNTTVESLMEKLKNGIPVTCALDLNSAYTTNYEADDESNEIIATIDNYNQNLGSTAHAVSCIGYECEGDYVIFIMKDSFEYGTTVKRPGIFKIKVNKNLKIVPFGVGVKLGIGGTKYYVSCTIPINKRQEIQKKINDLLEECCVVPTPTPTPSLTVTPSDIFGPPEPTQTASSLPPPTPSL